MLIAQISDLHIGFGGTGPDDRNAARCRAVIACLAALDPLPDLVVASGDLTEFGDVAAYRTLAALLAALPIPVRLMVGNHDLRAPLREVFGDTPVADGFVQEAVELGGRRLILLDTLEEGRAGGAFCDRRAAWLRARLDEAPATPTMIALHHPPFSIGIDWMDPAADAPWIERLRSVVADAPQVIALMAGHVHRPIGAAFAGRPFTIASSVAPQIALDFRPIDPHAPDGRALIVEGAPAFVLHRWTNGGIVSHHVETDPKPTIARLEGAIVPVITELQREGPGR